MNRRGKQARLLTGGLIGVSTDTILGDEHWDDVTLLLGGSSTTDLSIAGNALTNYGATTPSVTGPYGSTQNVLDFDATGATTTAGNYLETDATDDFKFGTSPFTIEMWLKPGTTNTSSQTNSYAAILEYDQSATTTGAWFALHQNNSELYFFTNNGNTLVNTTSSVLSTSAWSHVAIVRDVGNTLTIYVNGVSKGSGAFSHNMSDAVSRNLFIGKQYNVTRHYDGQIADIRITKGVARYTGPFDPPAASLPTNAPVVGRRGLGTYDAGDEHWDDVSLLVRGDTLTDLSGNHTIANNGVTAGDTTYTKHSASGSMSFDGVGDILSIPDDTSLEFGSDDFTVEAWVYHDGNMPNNSHVFFAGKTDADANKSPFIFGTIPASGGSAPMRFNVGNSTTYYTAQDPDNFPISQWVHMAGTRSDNTITLWINGVAKASTNMSGAAVDNSHPLYIGKHATSMPGGATHWKGNVEDFRITKGVARYTSNFTPPTKSLPTVLAGTAEATATLRTRGYIGAAPAVGGMLTLYDRYVDRISANT